MRWVTERKVLSSDNEILTIIEIYTQGESKKTVNRENKDRNYKRYLIRECHNEQAHV